ncbi:MAG: ATP-dependent zinc metalloprotease FtsH [Patescibacteria group bacterium]|nr:ATP-dependent zinc metalloprotease FtsH [Patescibacteria group bacterium]
MKDIGKKIIIFIFIFLAFAAVLSLFNPGLDQSEKIDISKLVEIIKNERVKEIVVSGGNKLEITTMEDKKYTSQKETTESFSELMQNFGVEQSKLEKIKLTIKDESGLSFWLATLLPFLLPFLLIVGFIWFTMRKVQGGNNRALSFGKSTAREANLKNKKKKTTFKDVAGVKEAKDELEEIVDFLKHPKKFLTIGASIPKGMLIVGPPGTGKTLLAKAVAGEANVPFFNISGSEFVEMFVGVGASRVRDLFKKAKKNSPCIIFIDEMDAVGRQRGAGLGGSHDEREQTLNQILVEMDGFETGDNVIVIAATNRPDVLDPALLRPGRFDRRVIIDMPDIKGREAILKVHIKKKPFDDSVDFKKIAQRTPGFSGADLANLLNESAILAAKKNKKKISMEDCLESIEKVMLGPERKSRILSKKEKKITAYHEAGHALVAHLLPNTDPVHKISIISRGRAAGYTLKLPLEDKNLHSRSEFIEDITVLLAGFTCEKETFNEITTGASNDLKKATELAKKLVTQFGMSEALGPRTFGKKDELVFLGKEIHDQKDYSEKIAEKIDNEVSKIIAEAYKKARKIISKEKKTLNKIVKELLEKETIEKKKFEFFFKDKKRKKELASKK